MKLVLKNTQHFYFYNTTTRYAPLCPEKEFCQLEVEKKTSRDFHSAQIPPQDKHCETFLALLCMRRVYDRRNLHEKFQQRRRKKRLCKCDRRRGGVRVYFFTVRAGNKIRNRITSWHGLN